MEWYHHRKVFCLQNLGAIIQIQWLFSIRFEVSFPRYANKLKLNPEAENWNDIFSDNYLSVPQQSFNYYSEKLFETAVSK